jgi:CRP/FNR family transcriptional regulator
MLLPCDDCPVRKLPAFRQFSEPELQFVAGAKVGERAFAARDHIVYAGGNGQLMYTLFSGWAYRYKSLGPAVRQIVDFLLPGDFIGLQSPLTGKVRHSVCALTEVTVCEIAGQPVRGIFEFEPQLGAALVETLLLDEDRSDRRLLLLGRQRPTERLAYLMVDLSERLVARRMGDEEHCPFPLTYDQMADALGLSRSQLARSLSEIRERRWADVINGQLILHAPDEMRSFAHFEATPFGERRAII